MFLPVGYGAKMAWDQQSNRVEDWLPDSFDETRQLRWFVEQFGSDEILVMSWEGCTFDDKRLQRFSQKLQQPDISGGKTVHWFRKVWTGPDMLEFLTSEPIGLSHSAAVARMKGWLVGPDDETTCVIALVSDDGVADRSAAVEFTRRVADSIDDLSRATLCLAGTSYHVVAINDASKSSLLQFNLWSFLICLLVLFASLKSIKLAWSVFITAIFCQQLSMALMYYTGVQMDSVLLLVANLTFVLTIAGGLHLVNYYLEARHAGNDSAVGTAVAAARRPTILAATTTAIGMLSLCVSQIKPVRNFGFFAALSVLCATCVLFVMLPVMIAQFPPRLRKSKAQQTVSVRSSKRWLWLVVFVTRLRWGIMLLAVVALSFGVAGVTRLSTSTRFQDFFQADSKVLQDEEWLEKHVANLVPVEVVVRFPVEHSTNANKRKLAQEFVSRLDVVEKLRVAISDIPGISGSITPRNFTPPIPRGRTFRDVARRSTRRQLIYAHRADLTSLGFWRENEDEELWRVSLRVSSDPKLDYGQFLQTLDERICEVINQQSGSMGPTFIVCGGVPLVYKAQSQLLNDLIASFGLALLMIAAVMIFVLRGLVTGLLAMIPNVLPSVLVFGIMGWLEWTVEIGAMLTATAAMGIAVDDTLHFITWFRRDTNNSLRPRQVLNYAYTRCGTAMIQTSLICSFGMVVFSLSPFVPIQRFAWLMFTLLLLALVCDLLVLPAVLLLVPQRTNRSNANAE